MTARKRGIIQRDVKIYAWMADWIDGWVDRWRDG
jgi:hypothetical protein